MFAQPNVANAAAAAACNSQLKHTYKFMFFHIFDLARAFVRAPSAFAAAAATLCVLLSADFGSI